MKSDLVTKDGQAIRKGRIRPALRTAIRLIVEEGISIPDAAKRVGYNAVSLQVALRKPHVRVVMVAVKRAWLDSETSKSWLRMAKLAESAASEDVQFKATKVFLDAAGELDGSANGGGKAPAGLVQIIVNNAQPTTERLPGVIEPLAVQGSHRFVSNSGVVGRDDEVDQ